MNSYDPNTADAMSTPIEDAAPQKREGPPTGLLKIEPEKNVDESQMADFSTPIEEVMQGPGGMIQDEVMGPPMPIQGNKKVARPKGESKSSSKNPFGLTDEQFTAAIAGLAAVIAFSKPVQGKLGSMVPKFTGDSGDLSLTGMVVSALVAAIVFYFAKQFLAEKA